MTIISQPHNLSQEPNVVIVPLSSQILFQNVMLIYYLLGILVSLKQLIKRE